MRRPVGVKGISFWYLLVTLFLPSRVATVATLPSALFDERFGSLGASWAFSSITWERIASRRRPAFSSHLIYQHLSQIVTASHRS